MKTIKFVAYLFYRYYSSGSIKDIPFLSTLCALVMLIGLHLFQIAVFFDNTNWLPFINIDNRGQRFFSIAIFLIPIFLVVAFFIRKAELKTMFFEESRIKRGNIFVVIYIIASMVLLLLLIISKRGKL